jgi:hypothetical protein
MKGRQLLVIVMLCVGLGATGLLAGCGGNSCGDVCSKAAACGLVVADCVNTCDNGEDIADCVTDDCDTDSDCVTFGQCVVNCFANP